MKSVISIEIANVSLLNIDDIILLRYYEKKKLKLLYKCLSFFHLANHVDDSNSLNDMWINVAGPLLVGDVNRRISPANTRTIHLQQSLYQQYMYNSTSPLSVPAPSFYINQNESSHVIPTLNNTYHGLTTPKHGKCSSGNSLLSSSLIKLNASLKSTTVYNKFHLLISYCSTDRSSTSMLQLHFSFYIDN